MYDLLQPLQYHITQKIGNTIDTDDNIVITDDAQVKL